MTLTPTFAATTRLHQDPQGTESTLGCQLNFKASSRLLTKPQLGSCAVVFAWRHSTASLSHRVLALSRPGKNTFLAAHAGMKLVGQKATVKLIQYKLFLLKSSQREGLGGPSQNNSQFGDRPQVSIGPKTKSPIQC